MPEVFERHGPSEKSMMSLVAAAVLSQYSTASPQPLRPPNGTYSYSITDGIGPPIFKSTIKVTGSGLTFAISETVKLPNGAIATTRSTWSNATLLPLSFEVRQGKVDLRARITPAAVTFIDMPGTMARIQGTSYILPSVGLIASSMMIPYVVTAHPGESFTLAEIQNNQTVLVRPDDVSPASGGPQGDVAITVTKDRKHGDDTDRENIVAWLNRETGVMDEGRVSPGRATIRLLGFTPNL